MTLKLRDGVSTADTDYGIALLDEDSGEYWNLNPTGALVLQTLLEGGSSTDAVQALVERYDVDADSASRDVQDLLGGLHSAGLAVVAARLLATQSPRRIRTVLGWLRRGVRPASFEQAKAARDTVVAVSLACASREGCVPRSLATVLLCRLRGQWPTWCVGARRLPPFAAHAWVEADGVMVGEDYPADYFRPLFKVP
jgi:hypothetical protein